MRSCPQPTGVVFHVLPGPTIGLEDLWERGPAAWERGERPFDHADDRAERGPTGEERVHGFLVGRVQHRRMAAARLRRIPYVLAVFEAGVVRGLLSAFDRLAGLIWFGPPDGVCSISTRNFGRRGLCDSLFCSAFYE